MLDFHDAELNNENEVGKNKKTNVLSNIKKTTRRQRYFQYLTANLDKGRKTSLRSLKVCKEGEGAKTVLNTESEI